MKLQTLGTQVLVSVAAQVYPESDISYIAKRSLVVGFKFLISKPIGMTPS
jgi:hypothetical protein